MVDQDAHDRAAFLAQLENLLTHGRLVEVLQAVEQALPAYRILPEAQLLMARSLGELGHFVQAEANYAELAATEGVSDSLVWEARLWHAFLGIFRRGDLDSVLDLGQAALVWAQTAPDRSKITGLASDFIGRALAIAAEWYLRPPDVLAEAQQLLAAAVVAYRQCGDHDRALATTLKQAQILRKGSPSQQHEARTLVEEAHGLAEAEQNLIRQAEAALRLAEWEVDAQLARSSQPGELPIDLAGYQRALDLYQVAEHRLGPADVLVSLGQRLVAAGIDGSDWLLQALHVYQEQASLIGMFETLSTLSMWYVWQGRLKDAESSHQQIVESAAQMGFQLGQTRAAMGLGDYYFRTGSYARALAAYEQADATAMQPVTSGLIALNLANTYTMMNLPQRAAAACREAIATFRSVDAAENLSLAYYILGNVLSKQGDWAGAIGVWRDGVAVDETSRNRRSHAEKLLAIAQATVMQHYHHRGAAIPEASYNQSMTLYEQAITLLEHSREPAAYAVIANAYQLQGQTALVAGRPIDGLRYLERSRDSYQALGMDYQTANTQTMLGMVCYDLSGRGIADLYSEAAQCYAQALAYFRRASMHDVIWKVLYYLALTRFRQGVLAPTEPAQRQHWMEASTLLAEASAEIDLVRGRFVDTDRTAADQALLALVADKDQVYSFAVQLQHRFLDDPSSAFRWLGQLKGRAFLDALAATSLRVPVLADQTLAAREAALLSARAQAATQAVAVDLSEQLYALWDAMDADPAAAEYLALRRGRPLDWHQLRRLLHEEG